MQPNNGFLQSPLLWRVFRVFVIFLTLSALSNTLWIASGQDPPPAPIITAEGIGSLKPRTLLVQHTADIVETRFTPNGHAFTTGGLDGQFCVWSVNVPNILPGTLLFCDLDYLPGITAHAWSADEKRLAITSANGTTIKLHRVYDQISPDAWEDNTYLNIEHPEDAPILSLQFVNGALLVYDINDRLTLYDWQTGDVIRTFDALAVYVHPDNTRFVVITIDDKVLLLEEPNDPEPQLLPVKDVENIIFSPDGRMMLSYGRVLDLWHLEGEVVRTRILDVDVTDALFTADDQYIATWAGETITLWDQTTATPTDTITLGPAEIDDLQFTSDTSRAVVLDNSGIARIFDVSQDGTFDERLLLRDRVDRVYISPDNVTLIVARIEFFARLYDVQRGQLRGRYEMPPDSELSPDWQLLATTTNNVVTWHTIDQNPTVFALEPAAIPQAAINIRETPSTELARIAVVDGFDPLFALGRTTDANWLYVVLPDGTLGWTFVSSALRFTIDLQTLPVISP